MNIVAKLPGDNTSNGMRVTAGPIAYRQRGGLCLSLLGKVA